MTRRKVDPKGRGDTFELRVKRELERMGHAWAFHGSSSEPGADILLLCCAQIVEAKKRPWSKLPSPKRRRACAMGDLYRSRNIPHQIVVGAPNKGFRWLVGGMVDDRASILYEGLLPSIASCVNPHRTGVDRATVPLEEREAE